MIHQVLNTGMVYQILNNYGLSILDMVYQVLNMVYLSSN